MSWTNLDDFLARAEARLDPLTGERRLPGGGDIEFLKDSEVTTIRDAAVLIGVIPRQDGATALLTQRPDTMSTHAGQVAFPGGKVDAADENEVAAALREAHEEVGIDPHRVDLIGRSAEYVTGTAFRITPVVGVLPADFEPAPCDVEVAAVFETPLSYLMNPENHKTAEILYRGKPRRYFEMPHNGYRIWGVTAGIIRKLYLHLYEDGAE